MRLRSQGRIPVHDAVFSLTGDTHAFDIAGTTGTWRVVIPAMSPPARFGFVSGVMTINGVEQWVISHGEPRCQTGVSSAWVEI